MKKNTIDELANPHDKFFKEVFSQKEHAEDFIRGVLPPSFWQQMDLGTLQKEDTSYLNESLKEYFSDVVYTCFYQLDSPIKLPSCSSINLM
ncbi:MAG: Rpn family recombination-promoting nuclease/putative transposase [Bacteroidia bacterium]|nr:Rpn family recombination-promoting nuclease/putative transposase [Bacteroidia bacterium]